MKCENCHGEHNGEFGSGRFCTIKCARGFSTKEKRKEINEKVSTTLSLKISKGILNPKNSFKKGIDSRRRILTKNDRKKALLSWRKNCKLKRKTTPYHLLSKRIRKEILIEERGRKCEKCKLEKWLNLPITLELDHINGDNKDNKKENQRLLCPNCHSYTPKWRRSKMVGMNRFERIKDHTS